MSADHNAEALVRLRNNRGADELNHAGVSYPKHVGTGEFFVPPDVAQAIIGHSGFYQPSADDHPEAGSVSLAEVIDTVCAMEVGPLRDALRAVLSQHKLL
jgi:hypothetical protein